MEACGAIISALKERERGGRRGAGMRGARGGGEEGGKMGGRGVYIRSLSHCNRSLFLLQ
jgi:hypothetical protein